MTGSDAGIRPGLGALGLPTAPLDSVLSASAVPDAVIMGLPFDGGVTGVPGQRHGPEIFRKLSPDHGWDADEDGVLGGLLDPVSGTQVLSGRRVFDLGDLGSVPIDPHLPRDSYYRSLRSLALRLMTAGTLPVFVGGDHSVSAAIAAGAAEAHGPLSFVCFDAHCDFGSRPMSRLQDITHADFLGYLTREGCVSSAEIYGVRTYLPSSWGPIPAAIRCAYEFDPQPEGEGQPTHLSVDLDVLDPSEFAATGHPAVAGYRLRELLGALDRICRTRRVVVVDIVEPIQDDRENQATSATISAVVMVCLRALLDGPGSTSHLEGD